MRCRRSKARDRYRHRCNKPDCIFTAGTIINPEKLQEDTMSQITVADALIEYLSSRGVANVFGVLAHTSFAIGDAIARRPHMKFVNAHMKAARETWRLAMPAQPKSRRFVWSRPAAEQPISSRLSHKLIKSPFRCL